MDQNLRGVGSTSRLAWDRLPKRLATAVTKIGYSEWGPLYGLHPLRIECHILKRYVGLKLNPPNPSFPTGTYIGPYMVELREV